MNFLRVCTVNFGEGHCVLDMTICNSTWFSVLSQKNNFCSCVIFTRKRQTTNQKTDLWDYQLLKVRKVWHLRQMTFVNLTFELIPKSEPVEVSVVKLSNNLGSFVLENLQSFNKLYSFFFSSFSPSSFFFTSICISRILLPSSNSSFFLLSIIVFFLSLQRIFNVFCYRFLQFAHRKSQLLLYGFLSTAQFLLRCFIFRSFPLEFPSLNCWFRQNLSRVTVLFN